MHSKDAAGIAGAVWSGSALFAQTYPSKNLGSLRYFTVWTPMIVFGSFLKVVLSTLVKFWVLTPPSTCSFPIRLWTLNCSVLTNLQVQVKCRSRGDGTNWIPIDLNANILARNIYFLQIKESLTHSALVFNVSSIKWGEKNNTSCCILRRKGITRCCTVCGGGISQDFH